MSKYGVTFTKYFSDKKYENGEKALAAAEEALVKVRDELKDARKVNGKLGVTLANKIRRILKKY